MSRDLVAGLVVCLVALPLCLGLAAAAGAPPAAGLLAGVVGGLVVGLLSRSETSVSGPAVGMIAVVVAQIAVLGSYQAFLLAVVLAGFIQIALGVVRGGFLAAFVPASVLKGFLAAIGILLVLKQIPHVLGDDLDPEGDFGFYQPDQRNTFTELFESLSDSHAGAAVIGLASLVLLLAWSRVRSLRATKAAAPLTVIALGVALVFVFRGFGNGWDVGPTHRLQVPKADDMSGLLGFLQWPDHSQLANPRVWGSAAILAAAASMESLINVQAVDRIDPLQRRTDPSRELWAQGVGNVASGLVGGLPLASVIVRSSVNVDSGGRTKIATIVHGLLLLGGMTVLADQLNAIPLACLAAILVVTGARLASPALFREMWAGGVYQFTPFILTIAAIMLTDLLVGTLIGFGVSLAFILWANVRRPIRTIVEKHLTEEVYRIELPAQVSFLIRAALGRTLEAVPQGSHVLLDARGTDYIDADCLDVIHDFTERTAPARLIEVSCVGFRAKYRLDDQIQYVDYSSRDLQAAVTPAQVLEILQDGHERFRTGRRLTRDLGRQVEATAAGQHPLAVVLSCIDSRTPAELIFDLGVGDVFSVRIAGNVTSRKVLGSIEFACAVAGAKLIVVMGHTRCGAVSAAVKLYGSEKPAADATGCQHIEGVVMEIQKSIDPADAERLDGLTEDERQAVADATARRNVTRVAESLLTDSQTLADLVDAGKVAVIGVLYDVKSGRIEFLADAAANVEVPVGVGD